MIRIDGASGEGGGQILRSALSLAMCLGQPVELTNIRANRPKPGLLRQHLTCVRASKEISNAEVVGDELGSSHVVFKPNRIKGGQYHFKIGSAGSTVLLAQTILPALLQADDASEIVFEGGTHNGMAPSVDFFRYSFLPVLREMGVVVDVELHEYGFYPAGGGRWSLSVKPVQNLQPIQFTAPGAVAQRSAYAISSSLPSNINERELTRLKQKCNNLSTYALNVNSVGPGNIVSLRLKTPKLVSIFESVGGHGVRAERVADIAFNAMQRYVAAGIAVEEYLADQLVLPMMLAGGGCFTTTRPSLHLTTNVRVIEAMDKNGFAAKFNLEEIGSDQWRVSLSL